MTEYAGIWRKRRIPGERTRLPEKPGYRAARDRKVIGSGPCPAIGRIVPGVRWRALHGPTLMVRL